LREKPPTEVNSKDLFLGNQPVFTEYIGEHRQYILYKVYITFFLVAGVQTFAVVTVTILKNVKEA